MDQEQTLKRPAAPGYDFFPLIADSVMTLSAGFSGSKASIVIVRPEVLEKVSRESFSRLSFTFTRSHLERLIAAALSPESSANDKFVCACLLKNAEVAAKGILPLCQDTGIANIYGWGNSGFVMLDGSGASKPLSDGAAFVYKNRSLRFSTNSPQSFFEEKDPRTNMPAQITIFASGCCCAPSPEFDVKVDTPCLRLLFCAKGGGSSNKTSFIQGTKASLNPKSFESILREQIAHIGTSACPPYTIAVVAGGLSPEQNMLTLKLASCGAYENMTYVPNDNGFRDKEMESLVMKIARETGYGAQFGGTQFAIDAVVVRLPRHGASCPISVGVSCSAHRNLKAFITEHGYFIQQTVEQPELLPNFEKAVSFANTTDEMHDKQQSSQERIVTTDSGIENTLRLLRGSQCGDRILLSGTILVARDKAHARWQALIDAGKPLPGYCTKYPICYAGPAETPTGCVIGSFGPTTAGRMDSYAESLMSRGVSLVTIAKGNRSKAWKDACAKYHAFYLGTPGGIAALIASEYISSQKIIDYEDLGMEAVRLVTVKNLPAFVITTDKGEDFYDRLSK